MVLRVEGYDVGAGAFVSVLIFNFLPLAKNAMLHLLSLKDGIPQAPMALCCYLNMYF